MRAVALVCGLGGVLQPPSPDHVVVALPEDSNVGPPIACAFGVGFGVSPEETDDAHAGVGGTLAAALPGLQVPFQPACVGVDVAGVAGVAGGVAVGVVGCVAVVAPVLHIVDVVVAEVVGVVGVVGIAGVVGCVAGIALGIAFVGHFVDGAVVDGVGVYGVGDSHVAVVGY